MDYIEYSKWLLYFNKYKPLNKLIDFHLSNIQYIQSLQLTKDVKPEDFMLNISKEEKEQIKQERLFMELEKL